MRRTCVQWKYVDGLNRLTKVDYPAGSATDDLNYSYDETGFGYSLGKLTSINFGVGSQSYLYDIYGNESEKRLLIDGKSFITQRAFNELGEVNQVIYPQMSGGQPLTIGYSRDQLGRVTTVNNVTSSTLIASNISYNEQNQITSLNYGNGVVTSRNYDITNKSYRLENITATKDIITLQNLSYSYDKTSRMTSRVNGITGISENFTYDNLGRVQTMDYGPTWSREYGYDSLGNISFQATNDNGTITTKSYTYDNSRSQILSAHNGVAQNYDTFGNISSDGTRSYVFDFANQIQSITDSSGLTSFAYNHEGLRVKKATPTQTTYFFDREFEQTSSTAQKHIFLDELRVATIREENAISTITYNHPDHLGSSVLKTDSSGINLGSKIYHVFGATRSEDSIFSTLKNGFTDQYEDETGLHYYKKRYYNSEIGRFLSADRLYEEEIDQRGVTAQDLNLFAYVKNDPLNNVDPSGEASENMGGSILSFRVGASPAELSTSFAKYYGVPAGTTTFNMDHAKFTHSPEFQSAMASNSFFTKELPMAAAVSLTGGLAAPAIAANAYMIGPTALKLGVDIMKGYGDPTAPSNIGESIGWGVDNWDNITSFIESTYSSFFDQSASSQVDSDNFNGAQSSSGGELF